MQNEMELINGKKIVLWHWDADPETTKIFKRTKEREGLLERMKLTIQPQYGAKLLSFVTECDATGKEKLEGYSFKFYAETTEKMRAKICDYTDTIFSGESRQNEFLGKKDERGDLKVPTIDGMFADCQVVRRIYYNEMEKEIIETEKGYQANFKFS